MYPKALVYRDMGIEYSLEEIRATRRRQEAEHRLSIANIETQQAVESILGDPMQQSLHEDDKMFGNVASNANEFQGVASNASTFQNVASNASAFQNVASNASTFQNVASNTSTFQNVPSNASMFQNVSSNPNLFQNVAGNTSSTVRVNLGVNNDSHLSMQQIQEKQVYDAYKQAKETHNQQELMYHSMQQHKSSFLSEIANSNFNKPPSAPPFQIFQSPEHSFAENDDNLFQMKNDTGRSFLRPEGPVLTPQQSCADKSHFKVRFMKLK